MREKNQILSHGKFISVVSVCVCLLSYGCVSIQWEDKKGTLYNHGVLSFEVLNTKSAQVFVLENLGLHLRVDSIDPGFTIGYRKYIAVKPKPENLPESTSSGYWTVEEGVSKNGGLFFRKDIGLHIGFSQLTEGFSLGYDRKIIIKGPKPGESQIGRIEFSEDEVNATVFEQEGRTE